MIYGQVFPIFLGGAKNNQTTRQHKSTAPTSAVMARQWPRGCVHRQSHPRDQQKLGTLPSLPIDNGMFTLENDGKLLYNSSSYLEN